MKDVKDFGAKGDGATDDTAAIQGALNSGEDIVFSRGEYRITRTISMDHGLAIVLSAFLVKPGKSNE
jgi:hypothetical protein